MGKGEVTGVLGSWGHAAKRLGKDQYLRISRRFSYPFFKDLWVKKSLLNFPEIKFYYDVKYESKVGTNQEVKQQKFNIANTTRHNFFVASQNATISSQKFKFYDPYLRTFEVPNSSLWAVRNRCSI